MILFFFFKTYFLITKYLNVFAVNDLIIILERFASVAALYEILLAEYIKYPHLPNTPTDSEVTPVHASKPNRKLARFRSTFLSMCA